MYPQLVRSARIGGRSSVRPTYAVTVTYSATTPHTAAHASRSGTRDSDGVFKEDVSTSRAYQNVNSMTVKAFATFWPGMLTDDTRATATRTPRTMRASDSQPGRIRPRNSRTPNDTIHAIHPR